MIHELRIYTLRPGKMAEYQNAARTIGRPVRGNDYGVNHGYWTTEFGPLNQIWHIWSYDSLDERTRLRAALAKNERWTREYVPLIRPLIERQDHPLAQSRETDHAAGERGQRVRDAHLPRRPGRRAALGR